MFLDLNVSKDAIYIKITVLKLIYEWNMVIVIFVIVKNVWFDMNSDKTTRYTNYEY